MKTLPSSLALLRKYQVVHSARSDSTGQARRSIVTTGYPPWGFFATPTSKRSHLPSTSLEREAKEAKTGRPAGSTKNAGFEQLEDFAVHEDFCAVAESSDHAYVLSHPADKFITVSDRESAHINYYVCRSRLIPSRPRSRV